MDAADAGSATSRDALLRQEKDIIAVEVMALSERLKIRILFGGGSILTAQRLISPSVSRGLSMVVDPASELDLVAELRANGWQTVAQPRKPHMLPPIRLQFEHRDFTARLNLFSVIPGFFADPEATFDLLWERRREIPLRGEQIAGLDRLASAVLASHNSINDQGQHASTVSAFFADQMRHALDEDEQAELRDLVQRLGAGAEMASFLESLGMEPVEFALPSREYVRWRLSVDDSTDQVKRAVALLELTPHGRAALFSSSSGRPHSATDVWHSVARLPSTVRAVAGSRRRWSASHPAR
jgi:hypothetical protein